MIKIIQAELGDGENSEKFFTPLKGVPTFLKWCIRNTESILGYLPFFFFN